MADPAFVVSVSGIPGSGKTTLIQLLLRDFRHAQTVYYDRFHPGMTDEQIREWFAREGDPNEFPLTDLIDELMRRTQARAGQQGRPLVLFETAFGRAHHATGAFIDFLVWIDTPLDIALSRACLVFLHATQKDRAPKAASDFIGWQRKFMADYPMLRKVYLTQSERVSATADLVLDGREPAEKWTAQIRKALAERGVR
jgi:uridine kinase